MDKGRRQGLGAGAGWKPGNAASEPGLGEKPESPQSGGSQPPGGGGGTGPGAELRPGSQESKVAKGVGCVRTEKRE